MPLRAPCTGKGQGSGSSDSNSARPFSMNSRATSWAGGERLVDSSSSDTATVAPTTPSVSAWRSLTAGAANSNAITIRAMAMAQVNRFEGIRSRLGSPRPRTVHRSRRGAIRARTTSTSTSAAAVCGDRSPCATTFQASAAACIVSQNGAERILPKKTGMIVATRKAISGSVMRPSPTSRPRPGTARPPLKRPSGTPAPGACAAGRPAIQRTPPRPRPPP